jgi:hypothetical protein
MADDFAMSMSATPGRTDTKTPEDLGLYSQTGPEQSYSPGSSFLASSSPEIKDITVKSQFIDSENAIYLTNMDEPSEEYPFPTAQVIKGVISDIHLHDLTTFIASIQSECCGRVIEKEDVTVVRIHEKGSLKTNSIRIFSVPQHFSFCLSLARERQWTKDGICICYQIGHKHPR